MPRRGIQLVLPRQVNSKEVAPSKSVITKMTTVYAAIGDGEHTRHGSPLNNIGGIGFDGLSNSSNSPVTKGLQLPEKLMQGPRTLPKLASGRNPLCNRSNVAHKLREPRPVLSKFPLKLQHVKYRRKAFGDQLGKEAGPLQGQKQMWWRSLGDIQHLETVSLEQKEQDAPKG